MVEVALVPNRGVLSGAVYVGRRLADLGEGRRQRLRHLPQRRPWCRRPLDHLERLPAGAYTVSAGLAGYSPDRVREGINLSAAATVSGLDFALTKNAGSLSGTVAGAGDAAGIRVNLGGKKGGRAYGVCDAAGKYAIPSLPEDVYTLTVAAPGYKLAGATQAPEVTVAAATILDLALQPAVFRLSGRLVNQAGLALAGLPIELRHPLAMVKATTGADGTFAFADVPAGGEYRLAVKPPTADHDPEDTVYFLGLDTPAQVTLNLATVSRQASLSGTVLLDGAPVIGAALRLTGGHNNVPALSQPGGTFRIPGVAGSSQTLSLRVSLAGAGTLDTTLTVLPAEARSGLTLRLRTLKVALSGTVTSSEGKPLAGARLVLSGGARPDSLTADKDGAFLWEGLAANQSLSIATLLDKARYDNVEVPLFLKEKDTAVAVRATVHAATVSVQVKDQAGAAVDGAEVTLDGRTLGTTRDGALLVSGLARGEYRFAAGKVSYRGAQEVRLSLPGDTAASLTLNVAKVVGGLYGTVSDTGLDRSNGVSVSRKLPGAVIRAIAGTDTLADTADALGRYSLDGFQAGTRYAVSTMLPGYVAVQDSLTGAAQAQARDFVLRPIPGSVLGRATPGRAGVTVRLGHSAGGRLLRTVTAAGGYYAFLGLQNRSDYQVQAAAGDSASPVIAFQANGVSAKRLESGPRPPGFAQGHYLGFRYGGPPRSAGGGAPCPDRRCRLDSHRCLRQLLPGGSPPG